MKSMEQWATEMHEDRKHLTKLVEDAANRMMDRRDLEGARVLIEGLKNMPSMKVTELDRERS
jgi:hypothetical protein